MTAPLTPAEHQKIVRCLEMTRSNHEGEVINAVRAAARILGDRRWSEVWPVAIEHTYARTPPRPSAQQRAAQSWGRPYWWLRAMYCADHEDLLTAWEREFVRDLLIKAGKLSARQSEKLTQISERLGYRLDDDF